MSQKVRIGFVGVGGMGQCAHLRNYVTVPECEVVALAELRPKLREAVAHKYGVLVVPQTATTTASDQLHDCGVVYYPNHPYLLCIMTSGNNLAGQQTTLKDISAAAYRWLDAYYKSLPSANVASSTPSTVTQ